MLAEAQLTENTKNLSLNAKNLLLRFPIKGMLLTSVRARDVSLSIEAAESTKEDRNVLDKDTTKTKKNALKPEELEQIYSCLRFSRRNLQIAEHILTNFDGGDLEAGLHIARAWHGAAQALALFQNDTSVAPSSFIERIPRDKLKLPKNLSPEDWEKDLRSYMTGPNFASKEIPGSSQYDYLSMHCRIFAHFLKEIQKQIKQGSKKKLRLPRISIKCIAALIALAIVATLFLVTKDSTSPKAPWRVMFYPNPKFAGDPQKTTSHPLIDFDWSQSAPYSGFRRDNYSVIWDSCLTLSKQRSVRFELGSDDGSRLLLDQKPIISMWRHQGFTKEQKEITLSPGQHHLRLKYFQHDGAARILLRILDENNNPVEFEKDAFRYPTGSSEQTNPCSQ